MKKLPLSLVVVATLCYSNFVFSSSMQTFNSEFNWDGFYIGENAGYWGSQKNKITATGSSSYINQTFEFGASNIANALAQIATNRTSRNINGFIGGGQVGYNYVSSRMVLLGLDINLDGLTNSNNNFTLQKTVNLVDFDESYLASLAIKEKINYLGTVRARLGYVYCPDFLVYATGGFAYGNITLDTAWTAQESLGPTVFPAINTRHNVNRTVPGWTVGGGIEWLFKSNWSAMLEYTYYSLNNSNVPATLSQTNESLSPPVLWGSAAANTSVSLSVWSIRLGINYHFS